MEKRTFYLGNSVPENLPVKYKSKDLTTHAAIIGMTGSGKTGLAICLLEEALMSGVPVIAIDPKGDLPNLLGFSKQKGIETKIYTPGSPAGIPVSILSGLEKPSDAIIKRTEFFADKVLSTASSILALVGTKSERREEILLSSILQTEWRKGRSLDLEILIDSILTPPENRIGVMDVESMFPKKDRFEFSLRVNQLLAKPGFEFWLSGETLDIQKLYGSARASIFSIAHLSDAERMFFVSIVLNKVIDWMRTRPGSEDLVAILYMDEVFGYLPPIGNPPSKRLLLTLLKQARAFGLGIALATQNPIDLDYKALSNAGTWMIGRLQTERDKHRLLSGLEGIGQDLGRKELGRLISGLKSRQFLLNNVHARKATVFKTRNAISTLSGPVTLEQIERIDQPRHQVTQTKKSALDFPPKLPDSIPVYFADSDALHSSKAPFLLAKVELRHSYNTFSKASVHTIVTRIKNDAIPFQWSDCFPVDPEKVSDRPIKAEYVKLPEAAKKKEFYSKAKRDFMVWIHKSSICNVYYCKTLKETSKAGESLEAFETRMKTESEKIVQKQLAISASRFIKDYENLSQKIDILQKQIDYVKAHPPSPAKLFLGLTSVVLPRGSRLIDPAFGWDRTLNIETILQKKDQLNREAETLQANINRELDKLRLKYLPDITTVPVLPKKAHTRILLFGLCWI
ncbi:MAG: ATP-binding protein [Deltaproteobacteria bacterium]|nr:ATP-binding protein [Deltaproteobacteria bacterium]